MVIIIYGTIGEYIKVFPLIQLLGPKHCLTINVNMQPEQMKSIFSDTNLPQPNLSYLDGSKGRDINTLPRMISWVLRLIVRLIALKRTVRQTACKEPTVFIVHGDTVIAPIAAFVARWYYRIAVGHVEAGYRSGNWRVPFPEELDRIITDRIATINYGVGERTIQYLRPPKTKGEIVDTKFNTIMDAVLEASHVQLANPPQATKATPYILISMHRSEIISQEKVMKELLSILAKMASKTKRFVWVDHAPTQEKITKFGLDHYLKSPWIIRIPKQSYFNFIHIVSKSEGIITDSGGLQEEAYLLGLPCLVHRQLNEKPEMGVTSYLKSSIVKNFIIHTETYQQPAQKRKTSPSQIIADDLRKRGYA